MKKKSGKEPSWNQIGKAIGKKIDNECETGECKPCKPNVNHCGGAFYGLGFIGALVYYIATATGFWNGVLGVLKAIVWPAFFVYGAFRLFGM
jgi:hypothetical protein